MKPFSQSRITKPFFLALAGLVALIIILAGIKGLQITKMIDQQKHFTLPPEVVTTAETRNETWETTLTAVGSLAAVQGVTVAAELPGKVMRIAFAPGASVKAGDLLVQQDTSSEEAQLRAAVTAAELAKTNLDRYQGLLASSSIAQVTYDNAEALYKQTTAQADNIRAAINKKHIRAPFSGRLGIRLVNLGQLLKEGEPVVSLQSLDPIFVNFLLPQYDLAALQLNLPVRLTTDALPDKIITGKITTINPEVDSATRNLRVQATISNRDELLRPGMFVEIAIVLPTQREVFVIPATAVLYAPYSDSVFVVEEQGDKKVLRQQLIRLGEKRGDFVAVTSGLKTGETLASTGVFKLRNGQAVVVDNTLSPEFKLAPKPTDD